MNSKISKLIPIKRRIDHEAFALGTQGVSVENALREIEATVNEEKAVAEHESVERTKQLEAQTSFLERLLPDVERDWLAARDRVGDEPPQLVMPLILLVAGLLSVAAEAVMLAPSLDAFAIANHVEQLVFALALGAASTIFFHFFIETMGNDELGIGRKWLTRALGAGAAVGLIYFGVVRGRQAAFAAAVAENPLEKFLGEYQTLTTIVFVFVTLAFPVAAAIATSHGLQTLRLWWQYNTAKRGIRTVPKKLATSRKLLESENEKLKHSLAALDEKAKRWKQDCLIHHERGQRIGAKQMALWMVWLKAITISAIVFCLTWWLIPIGLMLTGTIFLISWISFYYQRTHPSPADLFQHPDIIFRSQDQTSVANTPLLRFGKKNTGGES